MQRKTYQCVDVEGGPVVAHMIMCPACGNGHRFDTNRWTFDGNLEEPTFSPSMLVAFRGRHRLPDGTWAFDEKDTVCHSFVRNGKIEFLSDCTHQLAGQTVELERW